MLISNYFDNNISESERCVLDFILDHCEESLGMSLTQIAEHTFVSKTTVLRLTKKLGFSCFSDFKKELAREVPYIIAGSVRRDPNRPFAKGEKPVSMIEDLSHIYEDTIHDTATLLQAAPLERASKIIQKAHHIAIIGAYGARAIATAFGQDMRLIGRNVRFLDVNVPCIDGIINDDDVLIVVSYQELPDHVCDILADVRAIGAKIIVVSSLGINKLKKYANVFLPVSSYERRYMKIKAFSSQMSMMMVMNILFACYFQKDYDRHLACRCHNAEKAFNKRSISVDG